MRTPTSLLLTVAVAAAVAAPAAAGPNREKGEHPSDFTNQNHDFDEACGDDDDRVTVDGSTILWPPNHREVPYLVTAVDRGEDDETITLQVTLSHDEMGVNGAGDPSNVDTWDSNGGAEVTAADGEHSVSGDVTLRAERAGSQDGRQYTVQIDASFDGTACQFFYYVDVPHDMGVKPQADRGNGRLADDEG